MRLHSGYKQIQRKERGKQYQEKCIVSVIKICHRKTQTDNEANEDFYERVHKSKKQFILTFFFFSLHNRFLRINTIIYYRLPRHPFLGLPVPLVVGLLFLSVFIPIVNYHCVCFHSKSIVFTLSTRILLYDVYAAQLSYVLVTRSRYVRSNKNRN